MGDLIRREEAKAAIRKAFPSLADRVEINSVLNDLPSVNIEKKIDTYKQGWHDAIGMALKETHNVHTDDGTFRVIQEETLIGAGMSVPQVSVAENKMLEKIKKEIQNAKIGCEQPVKNGLNYALKIIEKVYEDCENDKD